MSWRKGNSRSIDPALMVNITLKDDTLYTQNLIASPDAESILKVFRPCRLAT